MHHNTNVNELYSKFFDNDLEKQVNMIYREDCLNFNYKVV